MKILSVDDDPIFLEIMKAELTNLGYSDVIQVDSGEKALLAIDQNTEGFDCFLLDIDMPGMDGVTLCERLRSNPQTQDSTVIMVTARTEMESVDRAFSVGATDYLNKPLDSLELRGRLKSAEAFARLRRQKITSSLGPAHALEFDFKEAIRLDPTAGCIEYVAMQNFILKLGAMQMFNRVALGVHIKNADALYAGMSREEFRDTLSDVAEVIVDALGTCPKVMSYAGSGDFVLLLDRVRVFDPLQIADAMTTALMPLGEWYSSLDFSVPTLQLGEPISRKFFNFFALDDVLEQAIESAQRSNQEICFVPAHVLPKAQKAKRSGLWS